MFLVELKACVTTWDPYEVTIKSDELSKALFCKALLGSLWLSLSIFDCESLSMMSYHIGTIRLKCLLEVK